MTLRTDRWSTAAGSKPRRHRRNLYTTNSGTGGTPASLMPLCQFLGCDKLGLKAPRLPDQPVKLFERVYGRHAAERAA